MSSKRLYFKKYESFLIHIALIILNLSELGKINFLN
jgi:hypothetical protein